MLSSLLRAAVAACGAEVAARVPAVAMSGQLRHVRSVGGHGSTIGLFDGPRHIAALATGGMCIVDGLNARIQIIDCEGDVVRSVEGLTTPRGVAIDEHDHTLYWCESTGAHVVKRLRMSARSAKTAATPNVMLRK